MYKINQVYQVNNLLIKRLDKSEMTLADVRQAMDLHVVFYISVLDDTITYYAASTGINLNLLLLETPFSICTTWEEIESTLNEMWVTSYKTKIPGYTANGDFRSSVNGYYVLQYLNVKDQITEKWKVDYLDHREWDKRSIPLFKGSMPDLLLEGPSNIHHKNCVVSCNGHFLYTDYVAPLNDHPEQLLIKDGARYLWNASKEYQPDIICFDFTPLGDIETYKINQFKNDNLDFDGKRNLRFKFMGKDLSQYTPLIVLAGALFFPHEIVKVGDTLVFNINQANVTDMLAKRTWSRYEYITGTSALESLTTPEKYLLEEIWDETCKDAFIVLIKNPAIYVDAHLDYQFTTHRLSDTKKDICGILRQRSTGVILGYIDSKYHNTHLLYMGTGSRLWRTESLPNQTVVSTTEWKCQHTNFPYMDKFVGGDDDGITTQHISTLDMFNLIS